MNAEAHAAYELQYAEGWHKTYKEGGRDAGDKGSGRKAGRDFKAVDTGEQPYRVFGGAGYRQKAEYRISGVRTACIIRNMPLSARDHHQP